MYSYVLAIGINSCSNDFETNYCTHCSLYSILFIKNKKKLKQSLKRNEKLRKKTYLSIVHWECF